MDIELNEPQTFTRNIDKKKQYSYDSFKNEKIKNLQKNYSSNLVVHSLNKHQNLKKEIDDLDEEIIEIQSKINEMLHD